VGLTRAARRREVAGHLDGGGVPVGSGSPVGNHRGGESPIDGSELRGVAHLGRADGVAAVAVSTALAVLRSAGADKRHRKLGWVLGRAPCEEKWWHGENFGLVVAGVFLTVAACGAMGVVGRGGATQRGGGGGSWPNQQVVGGRQRPDGARVSGTEQGRGGG
jgi:hypothetical protein